jgi:S-DNA-T family DNA segregation ATPase FtsK/SpoIIIE
MAALSTSAYRPLLAALRSAIADRLRAERNLAALQAAADAPNHYALQESLQTLTAQVEQELAAADARHAAERETLTEHHRSELNAIHSEYDRVVAGIRQRFADEIGRVESQHEENEWVLSSVLDDDSENSPKYRYETLKEQLAQARDRLAERWSDIASLHAEAIELVESRRQRSDAPSASPEPPRGRKEALERFDAADATVRERSERLRRQFLPRLFAGWTIVLLALGLWGGLFAAGFLLIDTGTVPLNVPPVQQVLMSAGAGFAATVLILLIVWGVAARQTADAFEPLAQAVVEAQSMHQAWLRLAKEELQRAERAYREQHEAVVAHRENAIRKFRSDRERRLAELHAEQERELAAPLQWRDAALREAAERFNRDLLASEANHRKETVALRTRFERERDRLMQEYHRRVAEREAALQEARRQLSEPWLRALGQLRRAADDAQHESEALSPAWSIVESTEPANAESIPTGIRLGDFELDFARLPDALPADAALRPEPTKVHLPAVLPFPESPSLLLDTPAAGRNEAVSVLQVAMLRLLTLLPPGKVRFTIIDSVGLGESFAGFMHLADYDDLLITGRIWTEPAHIEEQLGKLTEHMENVFQKYLRNEFATLEEYNAHAGEVAEPYRILVVAGFPTGFTERAAERLVSIATSGPRCGVYLLAAIDSNQAMPHGFDPAALETVGNVLRWNQGEFRPADAELQPLVLRPEVPPPPSQFATIVRRVGEQSKHVRRVEVPFRRIAPAEAEIWSADSRRGIDCPLGRAGATKLQHLRLGSGTSQHVLVAGKTGSGKSTLLHVLVTNLALRYAPDEVEFYLIDFKKGVEFKTYAAHRLPHARVIAIESDREFGVSVLERLDAILKERGDLFREAGVQDVAAFRDARPGVPLPRILLVVDEFQEFFTEEDRYAQTASLLLDRLVRQGRAFGIHVLLGSQTLGGAYSLARATIGQMAVRIALQCSEADASLILNEDNSAARLLTRPGEAIYNDAGGLLEGNSPFQIAWLGDDERDEHLSRLQRLAVQRRVEFPPPVVFEGNVPADPSRNLVLVRHLQESLAKKLDTVPPTAWLGEAVALTGPMAVTFRRQSGANLLVVGRDSAAAMGVLSNSLIALAAGVPAAPEAGQAAPSIVLLAGEPRWQRVLEALPVSIRSAGPDAAAGVIGEMAAELERRRSGAPAPPCFLFIDEISRFRDLRRGDDDFGFSGFDREKSVSPAKQWAEILRDGPPMGIHTIVYCDSYNNADRWLGRQLLREFEMRVVFQMSGADSSNLIDSPAASRLGTSRGLLFSEERGTAEKFRPYGPPSEQWLQAVRQYLEPEPIAEELRAEDLDAWIVT